MLELFLLAFAAPDVAGETAPVPCLPVASDQSKVAPSAIKDHHSLREALGEPMPQAPTMVMVYGKGGHLETREYSIIAARAADGSWRGTAVGRSQIWVEGAPFSALPRVEWRLDATAGQQLDKALLSYCPPTEEGDISSSGTIPPAPPRGLTSERIDIIRPGAGHTTFSADQDDGIAALVRPPD